jgi:hypothetical protein
MKFVARGRCAAALALVCCSRPAEPEPAGPFVSDLSALGLRSGGVSLFVAGAGDLLLESRCD